MFVQYFDYHEPVLFTLSFLFTLSHQEKIPNSPGIKNVNYPGEPDTNFPHMTLFSLIDNPGII
jgi:hypothetical protein